MCDPNCERCKGAIDFRCACGEFPVEGCKCDLPAVPLHRIQDELDRRENQKETMNSIFDDATETPCPVCLELATAGTIQPRAVMPLPQFPPRLKADNRQCCRDCQAAETLMRMGGHPKFGPSRLTVANDRLEGITMPPGMMELLGLCAMGYIHPCSDADLERHLDWLDRHGLLNSGRCEKSNTTEKTRRNHE